MVLLRFFLRRQSLLLLLVSLLLAGVLGMVQTWLYQRAHSLDCADANARHHASCVPGVVLLLNGRIFAGQGETPVEALAVQNGRVIQSGTSEALRAAYPGADKIDLNGQVAYPGFHDVRVQLLAGGLGIARLDLEGVLGLQECQDRITAFLRTHGDDPWIFGQGWSISALGGESLNRRSLDALTTERPLFVWRDDMRAAALNSKAMELLQIRKETPEVYLGHIERDRSNVPTGLLEGEAAEQAFRQVVKRLPTTFIKEGLLAAQEHLLSRGVTRVGDQVPSDLNPVIALQELVESGLWRLRVTSRPVLGQAPSWPFRLLKPRYPEINAMGGPIAVLDGSPLTHHASLSQPYPNVPGQVDPRFTPAGLSSLIRDAGSSSPFLLAEGDQALETVLEALPQAPAVQHPLVLSMVWSDKAIERAAALNVVPVLRPGLAFLRWPSLRAQLPDPLIPMSFRSRTLLEKAHGAVISSCWPESPASPLFQMRAAISTLDVEGEETMPDWYRAEALSPADALKAYTQYPAEAEGLGAREGVLAPGMVADLVVLDADPAQTPPEKLEQLQVIMTIVGGEVVWRREGGLQLKIETDLLTDSPAWRKTLARQNFGVLLVLLAVLNWPLLSLAVWMWQRRPRPAPPRVIARARR